MRVRQDDGAERQIGDAAQRRQRRRRVGLRRTRVDDHDPIVGEDEGDFAEVVALGDVDPWRQLDQAWRDEPKPVRIGEPGVGREDWAVGISGAITWLRCCLGRSVPDRCLDPPQGVVDAPLQPGRKTLPVGPHPLQVAHGCLSPAQVWRERGQRQTPEVRGQPRCLLHRAIEPGDRLTQPGSAFRSRLLCREASLEEPGQRREEGLLRPGRRQLAKGVPTLLIAPRRQQLAHQGEHGLGCGIRPADRFQQGLQLQIAGDRRRA